MRKLFLCAVAGLLMFAGVAPARAETSQEILDKLPELIRADAAAKKAKGGSGADNAGREESRRDALLVQIRDLLARGSDNGAENFLQALMGADPSDALRAACVTLVPQYRKEQLDKENALSDEGEEAVKKACDVVFKAKEPGDLDASRQSLGQWLEKREDAAGGNSPRMNRTRGHVQSALNFVTRWQDYLATRANGTDSKTLNETLRSLSSTNEFVTNLPIQRSAILALIKPDHPPDQFPTLKHSAAEISVAMNAVLERTKTLDDLPASLRDLLAIRDEQAGGYNNANSNDLNAALEAMQTLLKTRLEFEAGLRTNLELMSSRYNVSTRIPVGIESHLVPLRAQLVALELPRLLNAPAAEKPRPGETLDAFWRRLLDAAKTRGDWATVAQGLDVGRALVFTADPGPPENYSRELGATGFKSLLAAFNFEAAGQSAQAAAAYLSALASPVPDLPVKLIGERLAAIKKDHPKEYAEVTRVEAVTDLEGGYHARYYRLPDPSAAAAAPEASAPPPQPVVTPPPVPTAVPKDVPAVKASPGT